jgi:hypothetical protein
MVRIAVSFIALVVAVPALCADEVRTTDGRLVSLDEAVVHFWSMHRASSTGELQDLQASADSGIHVITVNTDPASQRSRIRPFLRARGLDLPVVHDVDGEVGLRQSMLAAHSSSTVTEEKAVRSPEKTAWTEESPGRDCGSLDSAPETYALPASASGGRAVVERPY